MYVIKLRTLLIIFALIIALCFGIVPAAVKTVTDYKENAVKVPVIMYHSVLKNTNNKFTVTPDAIEKDLKYLSDNGYTTIVTKDLIDYVYNDVELPPKPIILTFDDGHYNNYHYVLPLLKKYNSKAVLSVVGEYTDNYTKNRDLNVNYAYIPWDILKEMSQSGYFEIQNHTYNLHSTDKGRMGCKIKYGEDKTLYKTMLFDDVILMQNKCKDNIGTEPVAFTFPFGFVCKEADEVIKQMGFKASYGCEEGINKIGTDPNDLYRLKRFIRTNQKSVSDILCEYSIVN